MLHIHVLLAAPLCTGDMAQPGADKHEGGIAVREGPYHTGTATNLPVKAFDEAWRKLLCKRRLGTGENEG